MPLLHLTGPRRRPFYAALIHFSTRFHTSTSLSLYPCVCCYSSSFLLCCAILQHRGCVICRPSTSRSPRLRCHAWRVCSRIAIVPRTDPLHNSLHPQPALTPYAIQIAVLFTSPLPFLFTITPPSCRPDRRYFRPRSQLARNNEPLHTCLVPAHC